MYNFVLVLFLSQLEIMKLIQIEPSKFYMHEKYLCKNVLHMNATESLSVRDILIQTLKLLEEGNIPDGNGGRLYSGKTPISDIKNERKPNQFSLWYRKYGDKEQFASTALKGYQAKSFIPKWLIKGETHIDFNDQMKLINACKGKSKKLPELTKNRREANLLSWCKGSDNEKAYTFESKDLPEIAKEFQHLWPDLKDLATIANEIKKCL